MGEPNEDTIKKIAVTTAPILREILKHADELKTFNDADWVEVVSAALRQNWPQLEKQIDVTLNGAANAILDIAARMFEQMDAVSGAKAASMLRKLKMD